jgi:hypothetical protein
MRGADDLEKMEALKQRIIREKGWFIPTLHEKYLKRPSP